MKHKTLLPVLSLVVSLVASLISPLTIVEAQGPTPGDTHASAVPLAASGPITIRYDFAAPRITRIGDYHSVTIEGLPKLEEAGLPRLPIKTARLLIPFGQQVSAVKVTCGRPVALEGSYVVEPGQEPVPLSHTDPVSPTLPAPEVYGFSEPFPGELHSASSTQVRNGYQMSILTLYPVRYVPQQGSISYCASMTVQVDIEPAPFRPDEMLRHRPRHWAADREEIQAIVDNPEAAESYPSSAELAAHAQDTAPLLDPSTPYDYVIITNEDLMNAPGLNNFQALATAKEARGISTVITTTEWISTTYSGLRPDGGQDLQTRIRSFILDAYQTWGTEYILLGGDGDGADVGGESGDTIIPHRGFYVAGSYTDYDIPTDMYYACLDGTFDYDADGIYAEPNDGPGSGEVDLYAEVYVGRAAVDSADELANFVAKTLTYESEDGNYLQDVWMVGEYVGFGGPANWGGNSKDDIKGGTSAAGYTTVGFEDSPYANFFDVQTLYDRDCPGNDWPTSEIIDVINSPAHIINHLGHTNVTYVMKMNNSDVDNSLTNAHYFIGYSQGCYDGAFDNKYSYGSYSSSDSISEHLTSGDHGAVAFVSNSRYGWGYFNNPEGPSNYYDRQFWDAALGENIFNVGRANQDSKEDTYGVLGPGGFNWVMRWCYYELNLFGDPELVIKTGAGVVYQSHTIDDDDSGESSGNNNGRVDVGETIEMPVTLFNARQEGVTNVTETLSTTDPYVSITSNLASYDNIAAGGSATSTSPYVFSIDLACPDDHWITFALDITATEGNWGDTFQVQVHSEPQIEVSPTSYDETLTWGAIVSRAMTITNSGPAALEFEIEEVIYFEDFELGFDNWMLTGLWNLENEGDTCGTLVAPFPSSSNGAYYGIDGVCAYNNGSANSGELTMVTPVTLPASGSATLSFWSYEQTECAGNCTWDNRYVEISTDGGGTWIMLGEGNSEGVWYQRTLDLTPYLGSNVLIRFRFDTVDGILNDYFGWMVDNVFIFSDVPWLFEAPLTDTVPAYSAMPITITFDAGVPEVTQPDEYYATLAIQSNDPGVPQFWVPVTMTVTSYGIELTPSVDAKAGDPNATVTYTLGITNTGLNTDTFDIAVTGNNWTTTAPAQVGPLGAGASANVDVAVNILASVAGGTTDMATITVTSQGDDTQSATATLTTTANNIYAVLVAPPTQAKSDGPGTIVTYTLQVTNTGNTTDTFTITASGNAWPTAVPLTPGPSTVEVQVGPLAAGASDVVEIIVALPPDGPTGATDAATITFASQGDNTQSATAILITTMDIPLYNLFLPLIIK